VSLIDIKDFAEMNEAFGCIWWIRDFYESSCLSSQLFFGLARPTKHFGLNMRNWAACHPGCLAMVQWFRGLTSGSFRQVCVEVSALAGQGKVPKTSMSIDDHSCLLKNTQLFQLFNPFQSFASVPILCVICIVGAFVCITR
jgi:hypothetical protein